jgi:hypothetical protein
MLMAALVRWSWCAWATLFSERLAHDAHARANMDVLVIQGA